MVHRWGCCRQAPSPAASSCLISVSIACSCHQESSCRGYSALAAVRHYVRVGFSRVSACSRAYRLAFATSRLAQTLHERPHMMCVGGGATLKPACLGSLAHRAMLPAADQFQNCTCMRSRSWQPRHFASLAPSSMKCMPGLPGTQGHAACSRACGTKVARPCEVASRGTVGVHDLLLGVRVRDLHPAQQDREQIAQLHLLL